MKGIDGSPARSLGLCPVTQAEEFLYYCTVHSLKSSSSTIFLTPQGGLPQSQKIFLPWEMLSPFAVLAITLPSLSGD